MLSYFEENKEHRTIDHVEEAFKGLEPIIDEISEEIGERENACEKLIKDLTDFTKKYEKQINDLSNNAKTGFLINYWIFAIEDSIKIITEFLNRFNLKSHRILRKSNLIKKHLLDHLMDMLKGLFLIMFRIFEQVSMIINNKHFIPEKEIAYLTEDLVYYKNLYRKSLDEL